MNTEQILLILLPFVTYGVGELVKLVNKNVKGVYLLLLVGTSSGVLAFVADLVLKPDLSSFALFGVGLLSIVANQFYKQLQSGD